MAIANQSMKTTKDKEPAKKKSNSSSQSNKSNTSKDTSSNKNSSSGSKTNYQTPKTSNAIDSVKTDTSKSTKANTQKAYTSNAKDSVDTKVESKAKAQKPTYQSAYSQTMTSGKNKTKTQTKKPTNLVTQLDTQPNQQKASAKSSNTQTKKYDYSDNSNPNLPKQIDNQLDNPNLPNQIVGKPEIREIKTVNDFSNSNDYERYLAENKINSARGDALKYFQEKAKANGTTARQEMQSSRTKWKNALDTEEVRQNALNGEYTDEELSAVNQYAVYFNQDGSVYQGKELATYQNAIASLDEQEKQLEANYQYSRAQDNAIDNPNISTGDVYNTNLVNNDNYITEEEYKAQKKEIESQRKQANKYYLDNNLNTLTSKKGFEYYDWAKENDLDTSDFEAVAEAIDDDYVERLGNAYSASVIDTVNTFVQVPSEIRTVFDKNYDFTDENTWTSRLTQKANDLRTYAFSGTQGFENWSLQAVSSIMPQVNATLISVGTMGGSTALTTALMGLQTAGQVTRQRYEEGNDIKTALLNGVMHGIVSYAVEKIGAERFTSAITGEAESYLVGTALLSNVKLKNALQYINAIGVAEAGEEVMESFTNEIADDILNMFSSDIFGENADLVEVEETTPSELLNQMAMAYFGSGLVGAKAIGQVNINTKLKYNTALNLKAKFEEDRQNAIKLGNKTWQNIAEFAIDAINKDTQTFESKASPITFGVELKQDIADSLGDFNTWTEMLSQATQSDFQDKVAMAEQAYNNYSDFKNIYTQALAERGVMFKDNKIEQYLNLNEEAKTNVQNIVKQINDATPNYDVQFDTDMNANASIQFVDGKPLITLNPNSELAMEVNYTHELVHSVENSELYEQLADISFESETELQKAMKALGENAYKNADTETLQKEAVAKKLSEELLDEDFLDKLAKYNTDVGYKVLYDIRNTLSNIKGDNVMQQVENTLIKALNSQDKIYDMNGREINKSYLSEEQINEVINGVNISNQIGSVPFVVDELNIKNGLYDKYTIGEVEKSSTSNRIIYDGYDTSIKDFVNNTLNGEYNDSKNYKTLYIAKISNELSNEINNKAKGLNFDLTNYNLAIDSSSILHIKREHGNTVSENLRGQIPVQTSDFENLPYLIANADIIQKTVSKNGEPSINFITNMDNGRYTVVEFLRVGRHTLSLQTMYINQISKQKQKNSHNVTNESNSLVFTPEANSDMSSFNNNIANVEENVKQSAGDTLNNNLTQMLNNDNNLGEEGLSEVEINDFRRIQETSGILSREESEAFHKGDIELNEGIRRGLTRVLRGRLESNGNSLWNGSTSLISPKTNANVEILENVDGQAFHDIFSTVHQYLLSGDAVDVHGDYSNTKNFLSSDGLSGFAIEENGNLVSVFSLGNKGFLKTIKDYVKQNGATKLDCYNSKLQNLPEIYEKTLGFKLASILDFDYDFLVEDKGKEYADYFVENYGEAPVAFMVNTDQDIETKYFDKNSYSEAEAYRDSFISNEFITQSNESNDSFSNAKQRQFDIIQETNPAKDDIHAWIRSADEIKTFGEALQSSDVAFTPDFDEQMALQMLETGKGVVFSSQPIENGTWVTPSIMEAMSYSGGNQIYQREVNINDVAWVDNLQGMYAQVEDNGDIQYSKGDTLKESIENSLADESQNKIEDIKQKKLEYTQEEIDASVDDAYITIPSNTEYGKTRGAIKTLGESNWINKEDAQQIKEDVLKGKFSYIPKSNKATVNEAVNNIQEKGYYQVAKDFLNEWDARQLRVANVEGALVLSELSKRGLGDTDLANKIKEKLAYSGTVTGQASQVYAVLKNMSPELQVEALWYQVQDIQDGLNERYGDGQYNIELNEELLNEYIDEATTEDRRQEILREIASDVNKQIPTSIAEYLNAWRHLAMLSNFRTGVKNRISNDITTVAQWLRRNFEAGIEGIMAKKYEQKGESIDRYVGTYNPLKAEDRQNGKYWSNFYLDNFKDFRGKYTTTEIGDILNSSEFGRMVAEERNVWGEGNTLLSKVLNKYQDFESWMLSDTPAMKTNFAIAMTGYCKVNNIDINEYIDENGKLQIDDKIQKGLDYSFDQAKYITLNNANVFANWLVEGEKKFGKVGEVIIESFFAYKKVPSNEFAMGARMSPFKLLHSIYEYNTKLEKGLITPNQWCEGLASGLAGTTIVGLGALLAGVGMLRANGGDDDDPDRKKNFDDDHLGTQDFSINLPNGGSYTIDWMGPAVAELMFGAKLVESGVFSGEKDVAEALTSAGTSFLDVFFETTMMSGMQYNLTSYGDEWYSDLGAKIAQNYIMQFFPSSVSALGQAIDGVERRTKPNEGNIDKTWKMIKNKLPFLRSTNEPNITTSGEEEAMEDFGLGLTGRLLHKLVSPGTYKSQKMDEYDEELYRLYNETGEIASLPSNYSKNFQYDNEKYKFTDKEYTQFNKLRLSTEDELVNRFLDSDVYDSYDDSSKVEIIEGLRSYAGYLAKDEILSEKGIEYEDTTYQKMQNWFDMDITDEQKLAIFIANKTIDSKKDENGETITNSKSYAIADAYADAGVLEDVFDYIEKNGLDSKDFGINKTVYKKSIKKIAENYEEIYGEKFGTGYADAYAKAMSK